jgi:hypothetical protein
MAGCSSASSRTCSIRPAVRSFASIAPRGPGGIAGGFISLSGCSAAAARICICVSVSFIVAGSGAAPDHRVLPPRALQAITCQGSAGISTGVTTRFARSSAKAKQDVRTQCHPRASTGYVSALRARKQLLPRSDVALISQQIG